jgi:hypothetical protein
VFQLLVTAAPEGRVRVTVQPLMAFAPAVTLMVATKPPVHALTDTDAAQPPGGGGLDGEPGDELELDGDPGCDPGWELGGSLGDWPRFGVVQSLHSARLPCARAEIRIAPGAVPVRSRCFWMFCCNGVRHSDRLAQCEPSWTSDQYVMLSAAPSAR